MLEILDNSAAKSGLFSYKAPFILTATSRPIRHQWMHKDVGLALESGESDGRAPSCNGGDGTDAASRYSSRRGR